MTSTRNAQAERGVSLVIIWQGAKCARDLSVSASRREQFAAIEAGITLIDRESARERASKNSVTSSNPARGLPEER